MIFDGLINRLANYLGYVRADSSAIHKAAETRRDVYAVNQAFYDNRIYYPRSAGGCLENVLQTYCGVTDAAAIARCRMAGHFNPVKEIVEAYQYVLPGTWGESIKPVLPDSGEPVTPRLLAELTAVWRDSNLDSEKHRIIRYAANFGTVGIRVSRLPGTDRVAVQPDHPGRLFDVEEDAAGNVVAVVLKYTQALNFGSGTEPDYQDVEVIERIDKGGFSRTFDGIEQIPADDRRNPFGFCPYVLLRHKDNGTVFGDWSYKGSEWAIHDINWRTTDQGRSIRRHQFPNWFFTAGGRKPEQMDVGEEKAWYVQSSPGTPPPSAEAIVPQIDQKSASDFNAELRDLLRSRQPESNLNDVKLIAGLSGETIAQVLKPTEQAILAVRPNYDHAFIRALQMAISIRIDMGLAQGFGASGDAAYKSGQLAFAFDKRPALPPTTYQQIEQARAATERRRLDTADARNSRELVGDREALRIMGYSETDIERLEAEKRGPQATQRGAEAVL